jgi:rare lipoprotein A
MLRKARPLHLSAGAAMLVVPASAVALTAGQADAQSAIQFTVKPRHVAFGHALAINGNATPAAAGETLQLQFAPAGSSSWRVLGSTTVRGPGGFRLVVRPRQTGLLRVVPIGVTARAISSAPAVTASPAQTVSVAARFALAPRTLGLLGGQHGHIRGKLLPAAAGRRVLLLTRRGHRWQTLSTSRTGPRGGFDLPVSGAGTSRRWLRVAFAGDRENTGTVARAGSVTGLPRLRPSLASWYDDAGSTACGFHAQFGVANKSLPCGTHVVFRYGGRTVTAVVDDRGPFVGGREWDLNQNLAGTLGFSGVGTVWTSL